MSSWQLVARSLRHHWRSGLAVAAGCAVATAVIVGSLAVGDSVEHSLRTIAERRVGGVAFAARGRFVGTRLAADIADDLRTAVAAVVQVEGEVSAADGSAISSRVQVLGFDDGLAALLPGAGIVPPDESSVLLNQRLAERLGVAAGDEVVLRVAEPAPFSRETPFASEAGPAAGLRLRVAGVVAAADGGAFNLRVEQRVPLTALVSRDTLQRRLGREGEANLLLLRARPGLTAEQVEDSLRRHWRLSDAGLRLHRTGGDEVQLVSDAIFLPEEVAGAAVSVHPTPTRILGYLANEIRLGERVEPYAFVAAVADADGVSPVVPGMGDDEIAIDTWLAEGIGANAGDELSLAWWDVGDGRAFTEQRRSFTVRVVLPLDGYPADRDLSPGLPGLQGAITCSDWDPGVPLDLSRIGPRQEEYWDLHGAAPKAFVTLAAGQSMWSNRFGALTALRYPPATVDNELTASLVEALHPRDVGLVVTDVRQQAAAGVAHAMDFGSLVLGFGFFLLVASLVLVAMLFALAVQGRSETIGAMRSVGFTRWGVVRLLLAEGAVLAAVGALPGVVLGVGYTLAMVELIEAVWPAPAGLSDLGFQASPSTLATGAGVGILAALCAIGLTARRLVRSDPRDLLAARPPATRGRSTGQLVAAVVLGVAAVVTVVATSGQSPGALLGAGSLVVAAGVLGFHSALLRLAGRPHRPTLRASGLALRTLARRPGRATAATAMVALASFMVVAVEPYRLDATSEAAERSSGTGGFSLWVETSSPIATDLRQPASVDDLGIEHAISVVPLRVRAGDDASCLNLNRPQEPRVLGIPVGEMQRRGAFAFTAAGQGGSGWAALDADPDDGVVPAVADHNTLQWALGLRVGDEIVVRDGRGRDVTLRFAAALERSVLQGNILISEDQFLRLYPDSAGYGALLVDVLAGPPLQVSRDLSVALRDHGPEVGTTVERLGAYHAVENTYLSLFQMLSGLALLLGSAGLGIVLLRGVVERQGELAMLRAVGFARSRIRSMLVLEHLGILAVGVGVGLAAAAVATVPHHLATGGAIPALPFVATAAAVGLGGCIWIALAATIALRGDLAETLKVET